MRVAEGILNILVTANVGVIAPTDDDWPMFEGKLPDEPDQCIMVKSAGGRTPEVKIAINYPSTQVMVRGTRGGAGYPDSEVKAQEVFVALQAIDTPNDDYPDLDSCTAISEPAFIGHDAQERPVWSCNFNLITSKDSEGYRNL
jgi:hypothetical protein